MPKQHAPVCSPQGLGVQVPPLVHDIPEQFASVVVVHVPLPKQHAPGGFTDWIVRRTDTQVVLPHAPSIRTK